MFAQKRPESGSVQDCPGAYHATRRKTRKLADCLSHDINDRWSVSGGYRAVEGGVDVDEVYNFAWFNYAVFGFTYRWGRPLVP